jgi:hypothetical protein
MAVHKFVLMYVLPDAHEQQCAQAARALQPIVTDFVLPLFRLLPAGGHHPC